MDIKDQLILERDIKQQQDEKTRNEEILARQKREMLAAIDLVKKETEKLKELEKQQVKVMDEIRQARVEWAAQKSEEETRLNEDQVKTLKILNREEFVKLQESKLRQAENSVKAREQVVAEQEAERKNKDDELEAKKLEIIQREQKLSTDRKEFIDSIAELKAKVTKHIDLWHQK